MILYFPVLVSRAASGRYRVATIGGPRPFAREGVLLEHVKALLAKDLGRAVRAMPPGEVWPWFARPGGRLERPEIRIVVRGPRGAKDPVKGRYSCIVYGAPGQLGGTIVALPRAGDLHLHVPEGTFVEEAAARALSRAFAGDAPRLRAAQVERSEWLHALEVEIAEDALAPRARPDDEAGAKGLLAGPASGTRRKRTKAELAQAETLLDVGLDLAAEARAGRLGRAHGRDAETEEAFRALAAARSGGPRAVLLVGEPGTGKTAIVHELARRLAARAAAEGRRGWRGGLFTIPAGRLMAGMRWLGQWQERCLDLADEAAELDATIHSDSLPELMMAGRTSTRERTTATALLRPFVASGAVAFVGEATPEGLRRCEEMDRAFVELCRIVRVREPGAADTLAIALRAVREIEEREPCTFEPGAIRTALDLLRRFVPYEAFPGKAVRFLGRLAERARPAVSAGGSPNIVAAHALHGFTVEFGLASWLLDDRSYADFEILRRTLEHRVRGQPEAVGTLLDVVAALKAGLKDPDKPVATLLFVGPTGVGKTETAKALASLLFASEDRLLRFDLNEASDAGAAERLCGGPGMPEGELVRAIRERPFAVVLLDEVEKAHPAVLDLLLQLLGEGRLTDALGRTADARNAVFILTSNLGAERADRDLGFASGAADGERYERAALDFFRPELVNRLDRIVPFRALSREALREIARRELEHLLAREGMVRRQVFVEAEEALVDDLVAEGYSPRYGARPLRRAIERRLAAPLAAALAAAPGASGLLVGLAPRAGGETAIALTSIEGLGPVVPGPRPDPDVRRALAAPGPERAAELRARLAALERDGRALGADGSAFAAALEAVRADVDRAAIPFEAEGFVERKRTSRGAPVIEWAEEPRPDGPGVPPGPQARAAADAFRRLVKLERRLRLARSPVERVVLRFRPLGFGSAAWSDELALIFEGALEDLGFELEPIERRGLESALPPRAPGASAWLAWEPGLHEAVYENCGPFLARVAIDGAPPPPLRVVRKYFSMKYLHDAVHGASIPTPGAEPDRWGFRRALEEMLVAAAAGDAVGAPATEEHA